MRRTWVIALCFLLGAALLWLYFSMRLPPGVEAKGDAENLKAWISLAGAAVSMLTGIVGLALKLLELRLKLSEARAKSR